MKGLNKKILKIFILLIIIISIAILSRTIYLTVKHPITHVKIINKYSKKFEVDPYLIAAIINVESNYDERAISSKEARGLMQISPITGKWGSEELLIENFNLEQLFDPDVNIMIGTWYVNKLSEEFDDNIQLILAAYNGGSGNVTKWLKNKEYCEDGVYLKKIPFKETNNYVIKVLESYDIYKSMYKGRFDGPIEDETSHFIVIIHNFKRALKNLIIYK